jgi:hypothetical protein
MLLDLPDPNPDPLVRDTDQDLACIPILLSSSIISKKSIDSYLLFCDLGSGMGKKSGSGIQDEHPRSFFRFLGV